MFLINSIGVASKFQFPRLTVLVAQSCLPYLYPGTEKVSLPHHLPIPRRTHPSSAVSTLIYVDGEGEGEAGEGRKEGPCCVRAFMRPNFVDGAAEGGTNFSLKYHHCTASIFRASSILSVRPRPRSFRRFANLGVASVGWCYAMSLPFPSLFRPAHGDGQVHVFESYEEQDAKSYNPWLLSIIGCLITLFKSRWH